jgi:hypothetical protein
MRAWLCLVCEVAGQVFHGSGCRDGDIGVKHIARHKSGWPSSRVATFPSGEGSGPFAGGTEREHFSIYKRMPTPMLREAD